MPSIMTLEEEIVAAYQRIQPHIRTTSLEHSPYYSELTGANVYFKCENLQHTGSFKVRGAISKYLSLALDERQKGVVAASTGNHGKAVAYAARQFGGIANIFAPTNADTTKLDSIRVLDGRVHLSGSDCIDAESAARNYAEQNAMTYISPYNDTQVVAGQGTIGVELCRQLDHIDAVFASVGGGGMIGGIATSVRSRFSNCEIIGCSPENSNVMLESVAAGRLLDLPSSDTLSDGTAGGVEAGSITFELCRDHVDTWLAVSETEIAKRLAEFTLHHSMQIEGAAAVAVAGLLMTGRRFEGRNVVVVLCGANINPQRLEQVIEGADSND